MGWKFANREFRIGISLLGLPTGWLGTNPLVLSTNHGSYEFNLLQRYLRLAVGISVGYHTGWRPQDSNQLRYGCG